MFADAICRLQQNHSATMATVVVMCWLLSWGDVSRANLIPDDATALALLRLRHV